MIAPASLDQLVTFLRKSDLVESEQVDAFVERLRSSGDYPESPGRLAKALVRDGLVTHYQAEQLLSGRYRNFFVGGKYKVLERLGAGGMGNVFLCEHRFMRRLVALKVLPGSLAKRPAALARFRREARAIGQLRHPNIVSAYDFDEQGRLNFMVMEYVDGGSLEEYVFEYGPMEFARASDYIRQAAMGLQHAHESGLVHRDIKPSNLLVDHAGTVKLLDLGLALVLEDVADNLTNGQDHGAVLGTLDYLAPEQALDSHEVDIRADIYSLGATFYFLLTGRGLFPDVTSAEKLVAHQFKKPWPLRDLRPDVPEELAAIVDRMLAKDRAERHQTPAEVVAALEPWARDPVPPPPLEGTLRRLSPAAQSAVLRQVIPKTPVPERPSGSSWPAPAIRSASPAAPTASPAIPAMVPRFAGISSERFARLKDLRARLGGRPRWKAGAVGLAAALVAGLLWAISAGRAAARVDAGEGPPLASLSLTLPYASGAYRADPAPGSTRVNSLGMVLVAVPAGEFMMGSPEADAPVAERPMHRVRISRPFSLSAREVTVGQFRAFVEATGYRTDAEAGGQGGSIWSADEGRMVPSKEASWRSPGVATGDDFPVVQVSWNDAVAFCRWLSLKERLPYRLPTEAEWEYACRSGTRTRWFTGDDPVGVAASSWGDTNSGLRPHPVGRKAPNRFGLHDMHGNAREWCSDWLGAYAPGDAVDPAGPATGRERVTRGGSWDWDAFGARSAARDGASPAFRSFSLGFRVCQPAPKAPG